MHSLFHYQGFGVVNIPPEVEQLAQATLIRAVWQPWAQQHASALRAMLYARPRDIAALTTVRDLIPSDPPAPLVRFIFGDQFHPLQSELGFSWFNHSVPRSGAFPWKSPTIQNDFALRRDLALAYSQHINGVRFKLYASGRITKIQDPRAHQDGSEHDMLPPYPFLR